MNESNDAVAELLTLTLTVDQWGDRIYRNSSGQRHRIWGPAVEYPDGTRMWYQNDQPHRTDGPAVECADGYKEWWLNGQRHRTDGPAVECADGDKFWWLNGEHLTQEEHAHRVNPAQEMTVADIEKALGYRVKIVK